MSWLDELMDDVAVEVALEQVQLNINYEEFMGNEDAVKALAETAERIRKARSPQMLARMEREHGKLLLMIQSTK